jgi:hypothetical protein
VFSNANPIFEIKILCWSFALPFESENGSQKSPLIFFGFLRKQHHFFSVFGKKQQFGIEITYLVGVLDTPELESLLDAVKLRFFLQFQQLKLITCTRKQQ